MADPRVDDNQEEDQVPGGAEEVEKTPHVQADRGSVAIGGINIGRDLSGKVTIAGGNVYEGYTPEQVAVLLTRITSTFQPKPFDGRCPYKGLEVFEEKDAELFFGRERLVEDLIHRVKETRIVFITGPSGSGKSSLVRAGLIPTCKAGGIEALHSESWLYETIKPGRDPLEALALIFSRLKTPALADYFRAHLHDTSILNACAESVLSERAEQRFVLFIDQFEEVFTHMTKEEERQAFLNILADAIAVENGRVMLWFSMRSEFVSNCATYPDLNALLNQQFVQIGAMQPGELVSAIAQPALRVGLPIVPDLIAQIIHDMEGEPGALPLMEFALKDLFTEQQAVGGAIAFTLEKYMQRGGIHKSLERHADDVFMTLSSNEQELARTIFSSLIEIGRGAPDTGRTALFDELIPANANANEVKTIVQKLADARLITTDEQAGKDLVTISHEKLIDAWPWLRRLVNENRDVIALQNEVAGDAKEWDEHQRDASYLYTGARLANAREKLESNRLTLSGLSQTFLEAGIQVHTDELEAAKQRAANLRKGAIYLSIALMTALAAVGIAVFFGLKAFTRQLAAQATVIQDDKRDLAMLMSVQAYKMNDDFETRSSSLSALQCCSDGLISFLRGHQDSIWDVAFSPDSKRLASAGNDGSILIWDVASRTRFQQIKPNPSPTIYTIAFSPDGKFLAAGDAAGAITLYDTQTWKPAMPVLHEHTSSVLSIEFSKDGRWLVSGGQDGKVLVWDVTQGRIAKNLTGAPDWVWSLAVSADMKTVAAAVRPRKAGDQTLYLWDLEADSPVQPVTVYERGLVSVAFNDNPNSQILVTGDRGGNVIVWDMRPWRNKHEAPEASNPLPTGAGASSSVWGLTFITGHQLEIVTSRDNGIINRNLISLSKDHDPANTKLERQTLGMTGNNFGFFRLAASPDGKYIAAAGQDGLVSLWHASEVPSVIRHSARVTTVQILNSRSTTAESVDSNGRLYRWDYQKQIILDQRTLDAGPLLASAISVDGNKVVTGYEDGTLILWDGKTGKQLSKHTDHKAPITSTVFSPDGNQFASSDGKGNVILWKVNDKHLELSDHFMDSQESAIQALLFSKDGKTLVGGGCAYPILFPNRDCSQGAIYIWRVGDKLSTPVERLQGTAGFMASLAFNPVNPNELAVGGLNGAVTIWNLGVHRPRLTLRPAEGPMTALAFSPDGKLLAIGADGYKVFLFDARTGQKFGQSFREHDGSVIALAFTPDGSALLSASSDSTVVIHPMNPSDWQARACRIANRNLDQDEWNVYISNKLPYRLTCPNTKAESQEIVTP